MRKLKLGFDEQYKGLLAKKYEEKTDRSQRINIERARLEIYQGNLKLVMDAIAACELSIEEQKSKSSGQTSVSKEEINATFTKQLIQIEEDVSKIHNRLIAEFGMSGNQPDSGKPSPASTSFEI